MAPDGNMVGIKPTSKDAAALVVTVALVSIGSDVSTTAAPFGFARLANC